MDERRRRFALTPEGFREASRMVRNHRLWELYLTQRAGYAQDHVHDSAEEMEHLLAEENIADMMRVLGNPQTDPHGKPIPSLDDTPGHGRAPCHSQNGGLAGLTLIIPPFDWQRVIIDPWTQNMPGTLWMVLMAVAPRHALRAARQLPHPPPNRAGRRCHQPQCPAGPRAGLSCFSKPRHRTMLAGAMLAGLATTLMIEFITQKAASNPMLPPASLTPHSSR